VLSYCYIHIAVCLDTTDHPVHQLQSVDTQSAVILLYKYCGVSGYNRSSCTSVTVSRHTECSQIVICTAVCLGTGELPVHQEQSVDTQSAVILLYTYCGVSGYNRSSCTSVRVSRTHSVHKLLYILRCVLVEEIILYIC